MRSVVLILAGLVVFGFLHGYFDGNPNLSFALRCVAPLYFGFVGAMLFDRVVKPRADKASRQ